MIDGVIDAVAVSVKKVDVSDGVTGVDVLLGSGVRVFVGVLVSVIVGVFCVDVLLGVAVTLGVDVCVG